MLGVEPPQGLDGRIECPVGQIGKEQRGLEQRHHVGIGRNKDASAVECADRRIGPVQTELLFQTMDVLQTQLHQSFGFRLFRMKDLDRDLGAERRSAPDHGNAGPREATAAE